MTSFFRNHHFVRAQIGAPVLNHVREFVVFVGNLKHALLELGRIHGVGFFPVSLSRERANARDCEGRRRSRNSLDKRPRGGGAGGCKVPRGLAARFDTKAAIKTSLPWHQVFPISGAIFRAEAKAFWNNERLPGVVDLSGPNMSSSHGSGLPCPLWHCE
jgi:hypothetical protein